MYIDGIDPTLKNGTDKNGETCLGMAAKRGTLEFVKFLVGEDPEFGDSMKLDTERRTRFGKSVLINAVTSVQRWRKDIVKYLADYNPNLINMTDDAGNNALVHAVWY